MDGERGTQCRLNLLKEQAFRSEESNQYSGRFILLYFWYRFLFTWPSSSKHRVELLFQLPFSYHFSNCSLHLQLSPRLFTQMRNRLDIHSTFSLQNLGPHSPCRRCGLGAWRGTSLMACASFAARGYRTSHHHQRPTVSSL